MRAALVLAMLAGPGWAESWIDYELLLEQNADKVVVITDPEGRVTRQIDFGDGVTVSCRDSVCEGSDTVFATGCLWHLATQLRLMAEVCGVFSDDDRATLLSVQARFAAHVAENALPKHSLTELEAHYQDRVRAWARLTQTEQQAICTNLGGWSGLETAMLLDAITAPESMEEIETKLAAPRLPMPCPRLE
jgi:hypothetical protein